MDLRPSSAEEWFNCSVQPWMVAKMPPEIEGDPAREGTCAAWVAEMVLTGEVSHADDLINTSHENGWLIEADMTTKIQRYVELIRSYGGEIHTERKVRLNQYIAGTPDAFAVVQASGTLIVDDLKYGFGIVEPYKNKQVSIYTGAIIKMLRAAGVKITKVVIGIYQPRAFSAAGIHRTWECTPEELMEFVAEIEARGELAQNPNAPATAGSHCEYCAAASTCVANTNGNARNYEYLAAQEQRHMTAYELSEYLKFLELAEAMLKGAKSACVAEASARIKRSETIPDWHMRQGAGRRRFTVDPLRIAATLGVRPFKSVLISPTDAERLKVDAETLSTITETPRTKATLKRLPEGYFKNMFKGR